VTFRLSEAQSKVLRRTLTALLSPHAHGSTDEWLFAVMRSMRPLMNAQKAAIRLRTPGGLRVLGLDHDRVALDSYERHYHKFDFGRAISGNPPRPRQYWTFDDQYGARMADFRRSEYYKDFLAPNRLFHCGAVATHPRADRSDAILYVHRDRRSAPNFDAESKGIMQLVAPVLAAALRASRIAGPSYESFVATIDDLRDGCALFAPTGLLLHRNPALSSLVETQPYGADVWMSIQAAARDVLEIFLKTTDVRDLASHRSKQCIVRGRTYTVSACVIGYFDDVRSTAILVIVKPSSESSHGFDPDAGARFDLSPRQCQVARYLAARLSAKEIAARMGISEHTARHHTESVMKKLGVTIRRAVAAALVAESSKPDH
jgi:DNA-binding CsgD family transcriptional regulator